MATCSYKSADNLITCRYFYLNTVLFSLRFDYMKKALSVLLIVLIVLTLCISCKKTEHSSAVGSNGETVDITSKYDSKGNLRYEKTVYSQTNKTIEKKYNSDEKIISKKIVYSEGPRIEEKFDNKGNLISNKFINTEGYWNIYEYEYNSTGNFLDNKDDYFKDLI